MITEAQVSFQLECSERELQLWEPVGRWLRSHHTRSAGDEHRRPEQMRSPNEPGPSARLA